MVVVGPLPSQPVKHLLSIYYRPGPVLQENISSALSSVLADRKGHTGPLGCDAVRAKISAREKSEKYKEGICLEESGSVSTALGEL